MTAEFPLKIAVGAVDRATAPLRKIQARIDAFAKPFKALNERVKVFSDTAGLKRVGGAWDNLIGKGRDLGSALSAATAKALGLGVALGAAFKFTLVDFARDAGAVEKMAKVMGISTDALQEWTHIAHRANIENEVLVESMREFTLRLGEAAAGEGQALPVLKGLGIELRDTAGRLRTVDDLLPEVAEKLGRLQDVGLRSFATDALFGGEAESKGFVNLLRLSREEIVAMRQEARRLGVVIPEESIRKAEEFRGGLGRLKTVAVGFRNAFGAALTPAALEQLERLQGWLQEQAPKVSAWADGFAAKLPERLQQIGGAFKEAWSYARPFVAIGRDLIETLGPGRAIVLALAVGIGGPLVLAFLAATKAALGFGLALLTTPIGWITLGLTALGALAIAVWANWEELGIAFKWLWHMIGLRASLLWEQLKSGFEDAWNWIGDKVDSFVERVRSAFNGLGDWLLNSRVGKFLTGVAEGLGLDILKSPAPAVANHHRIPFGPFTDPRTAPRDPQAALHKGTLERLRAAKTELEQRQGAAPNGTVTVEFKDMPRGVRVHKDSRAEGIDLSQGYSMAW